MCPQLICIIGFGRLEARHVSNKPLGAQESHENSPKPRVESNFRSLHSYLDQNETVKKQILLISYSFKIH